MMPHNRGEARTEKIPHPQHGLITLEMNEGTVAEVGHTKLMKDNTTKDQNKTNMATEGPPTGGGEDMEEEETRTGVTNRRQGHIPIKKKSV